MAGFDWSPYFGGYDLNQLFVVAMSGAVALAPLILYRLGFTWALSLIEGMRQFFRRL